jgi:hypothetical protein
MNLEEASGNPMCYFHRQVGGRFRSWRLWRGWDHGQGNWVEHILLESTFDGAPLAAPEVTVMHLLLGLGDLSIFLDELVSQDLHHLFLTDLL